MINNSILRIKACIPPNPNSISTKETTAAVRCHLGLGVSEIERKQIWRQGQQIRRESTKTGQRGGRTDHHVGVLAKATPGRRRGTNAWERRQSQSLELQILSSGGHPWPATNKSCRSSICIWGDNHPWLRSSLAILLVWIWGGDHPWLASRVQNLGKLSLKFREFR